MSWRHAGSDKKASAPAPRKSRLLTRTVLLRAESTEPRTLVSGVSFLFFNFGHLFGVKLFEERLGLRDVELGIGRLDAQEKPVDGRALGKALHIEHRMIGHRQLVEGQHPDNGAQR